MEPQRTDGAVGLHSETDADLLTLMSWRSSEEEAAREAGDVFYRRHVSYVYVVSLRAVRKYFMDESCAEDLTSETFSRVYERAGTFKCDSGLDFETLRLRVRAWIGAIANNVLMDALRARQAERAQQLDEDAWDEQPAEVPPEDSAAVALVRRAMEEVLNDREREVLRVTFLTYKPGAKQQRLSNSDTADLAKTLQTTPDNLRKIRRNAMRKIRDYMISQRTQSSGEHHQHAEDQP